MRDDIKEACKEAIKVLHRSQPAALSTLRTYMGELLLDKMVKLTKMGVSDVTPSKDFRHTIGGITELKKMLKDIHKITGED